MLSPLYEERWSPTRKQLDSVSFVTMSVGKDTLAIMHDYRLTQNLSVSQYYRTYHL